MAITLISKPSNWARVLDTNRCSYIFSSDQYTMPNFNFLIELYVFDLSVSGTSAKTLIGTFKLYPLSGGTCEFNPTSVYKNYLSYDINLSTDALSDCSNSAKEFQLVCNEYYSSSIDVPPQKQGTPYTEPGRGTIFYNGCQQLVPYDYIPLNFLQGNNLQWVMSGATSGKFLTDATDYHLDNEDEAYLYFLCEKDQLPTSIQFKVCSWDSTTGATILPDPNIIDNYIGLSSEYNYQTSQSDSMPQTRAVSANYYNTGTTVTAICERYKIVRGSGMVDLSFGFIDCTGVTRTYTITSGSMEFTARKGSVIVYEGNYTLYDLGPVSTIPPPVIIVPPPTPKPHISCQYIYDGNIGYINSGTKMWYFPISMRSLIRRKLITNVLSKSWLYYTVDLLSGTTKINKNPFYVYKKCKDSKYSKWQIFFMNSHGGFDRFTFDRKIDINYDIERTTYGQRMPAGTPTSFDTYFGGEKVFNTNVTEEITLRTYLLTQMESQLMIVLFKSPVVYLMKEYQYDPVDPTQIYKYGVPLIITSKEMKYEQKKNSKEIYYEIKVKYANKSIVQGY